MSYRFTKGRRPLINRPKAASRFLANVRARRQQALVGSRAHMPRRPFRFGENKYVDIATNAYQLDTTGDVVHLDVVPQGSSVSERDGRKFMVRWVSIRGFSTNLTTATQNKCAIILVWDNQPAKSLAAMTDLLDSASSESQNKRENASRFRVLRRWDFMLTGKGDASTTPGFSQTFDHFVRLPYGLVAECTPSDTTGAIGNRVSGALLLFTVGQTAAGTAGASASLTMRVGFTDV